MAAKVKKPKKVKALPPDALNVTMLKFDDELFACYGKQGKRSYGVYCRRQGDSGPRPSQLVPMPKLPPKDSRPKRYFQKKRYIGIKFRREEHGEWLDTLWITNFAGRPLNAYEYKVIIEYSEKMWDALIKRIKSEAETQNRNLVIHQGENGYAYTTAKIISTPR